MTGGGLVALAARSNPVGYPIKGTPDVFVGIGGR